MCPTFYRLGTLTVSKVKSCAFLGIKIMVYFSGTAFRGVMPLLCCFPVTFSHVLPGACHQTRGKSRRRLGVPSTLPISPFPTYPTQKLVSCLPPDPLPQIKWPSLPYQIPLSKCALTENFQPAFYGLAQISAQGHMFLVLALIVELKTRCPIKARQLEKGEEGRWEAGSGARRLGGSSRHCQGLDQRLPM